MKGTQHLAFIGSCMTNLLFGDGERELRVIVDKSLDTRTPNFLDTPTCILLAALCTATGQITRGTALPF